MGAGEGGSGCTWAHTTEGCGNEWQLAGGVRAEEDGEVACSAQSYTNMACPDAITRPRMALIVLMGCILRRWWAWEASGEACGALVHCSEGVVMWGNPLTHSWVARSRITPLPCALPPCVCNAPGSTPLIPMGPQVRVCALEGHAAGRGVCAEGVEDGTCTQWVVIVSAPSQIHTHSAHSATPRARFALGDPTSNVHEHAWHPCGFQGARGHLHGAEDSPLFSVEMPFDCTPSVKPTRVMILTDL